MFERAVAVADLGIKAHAHMLRHPCGYKLANDGHDTRAIQAYLGHRNIQNTSVTPPWLRSGLRSFFDKHLAEGAKGASRIKTPNGNSGHDLTPATSFYLLRGTAEGCFKRMAKV